MGKVFATPNEFDNAVKRAVREAGKDSGAKYRQVLRDRFLCRVFRNDNRCFVLKGGTSMLARVPNARATRDVDFGLLSPLTSQEVVRELVGLASADLGDFCRFELTKTQERTDDNGYSRLIKLRFATYIGVEEKDPILIDLSLDCDPVGELVKTDPVNRVALPSVETASYVLYPVADQLADKLCAIMEMHHNGYPSSRMKDMVDVVLLAQNQAVTAAILALAIKTECGRRSMGIPQEFTAPALWEKDFARFAKGNGFDMSFEDASVLSSKLFNPILSGLRQGEWSPQKLAWCS